MGHHSLRRGIIFSIRGRAAHSLEGQHVLPVGHHNLRRGIMFLIRGSTLSEGHHVLPVGHHNFRRGITFSIRGSTFSRRATLNILFWKGIIVLSMPTYSHIKQNIIWTMHHCIGHFAGVLSPEGHQILSIPHLRYLRYSGYALQLKQWRG